MDHSRQGLHRFPRTVLPTKGSRMVNFHGANQAHNTVISQSVATIAGQSHTLPFDAGLISYNPSLQTLKVSLAVAIILLLRTPRRGSSIEPPASDLPRLGTLAESFT